MVEMALQSAVRNQANKKHLSLLQIVEQFNIPYKGIDDSGSVPHTDAQTEHNRAFEMARHIIRDGVNALKGSSGVIVCDIGNMYAPKLTAILRIFTLLKDALNIFSIVKDNIKIEIT